MENYTTYDLEMNWSQKYATAVGLSTVDDKNIGIIRDFIKNKAKMGEEVLATFEELWIHGDEKTADRIAEFELMDMEELEGG